MLKGSKLLGGAKTETESKRTPFFVLALLLELSLRYPAHAKREQGRTIPEGNIRGGAKRSLVAWFESGKRRIFQRCVPQAERDVHFVRDVSFGSEVCLRHEIRNTLLHCEQSEQHHYAKHDITWHSQTSLKSQNYRKISQDRTECDFFLFQ